MPVLQTGPNQRYLASKAAKNIERNNMIRALGPKNPISNNQSAKATTVAESLVKPFPTRSPTRSASASSLTRKSPTTLPRVPSAPTLPTPNRGVLGTTVNGLGTATKATGNALVKSGKFIGNVTENTVGAIGTVASKLNPASWFGGKRRRTRRAHKKNRSKHH